MPCNRIDLFDVEDKIVLLEEPGHRRAVDLHLEPADAQGAKRHPALTLLAIVGRLDAADAGGRHGVHIGDRLDGGNSRPGFFLDEFDPGSPAGQNHMRAVDGARGRGFVSNLERHNVQVEAIVDRAAGILARLMVREVRTT